MSNEIFINQLVKGGFEINDVLTTKARPRVIDNLHGLVNYCQQYQGRPICFNADNDIVKEFWRLYEHR